MLNASWTVAFFILAAKLSKIDGHVNRDEIATIKRVFAMDKDADKVMGPIFREAIADTADYESYARQVSLIFKDNRQTLQQLLGALVLIATCDGVYHPNERKFIAGVARCFGFSQAELGTIESGFMASGAQGSESDPYEVLGVVPDATDSEIRAAHRRIIKESHPDLAVSKGLPEEFVELCNQKMANANAAYDRIKQSRGIN